MPRHLLLDGLHLLKRPLNRRLAGYCGGDPNREENPADSALAHPWYIDRAILVPLADVEIVENKPLCGVGVRVDHQRPKMNIAGFGRDLVWNFERAWRQKSPRIDPRRLTRAAIPRAAASSLRLALAYTNHGPSRAQLSVPFGRLRKASGDFRSLQRIKVLHPAHISPNRT